MSADDRLDAFEVEVKGVLAEHSTDGAFLEDNEFVIRLGRMEWA